MERILIHRLVLAPVVPPEDPEDEDPEDLDGV